MTTRTKPTGTRGYCYVRTSKDVQDKRSQREALQRWLDKYALTPREWIEDSGARDLAHKREGFQRLLGLVQAGEVDWVAVAERDRFGVSGNREYQYYLYILERHGVRLWCAAEDRELTDDADLGETFMSTFRAEKSRQEQRDNATRIYRGKMAQIARGEWPGGKPPYGFDTVCRDPAGRECWRMTYLPGQYRRLVTYPDGQTREFLGKDNVPGRSRGEVLFIERTKDTAVEGWVRKIFEWFRDGYSYRAVASLLNDLKVPAIYRDLWLGPTVQSILRNPAYALGVPVYNKAAHGRFVQWVGGQLASVEKTGGRAKAGRKRAESDYLHAPPRPDNAIIEPELWNAVQERIRALRASPKSERRPRSAELFLSGLVACGDCGERMVAWSQQNAYRCTRNMHDSKLCRCNKTRHGTLEELVVRYLEAAGAFLGPFVTDPDMAEDLVLPERAAEPLLREYNAAFTRMIRGARAAGQTPPPGPGGEPQPWTFKALRERYRPAAAKRADDLVAVIREKEEERDRLAKRLGLVDDAAAAAVVARLRAVSDELRELREKARPLADRLDALREQVVAYLERVRDARRVLAESQPREKGEVVRRVVSQIRVHHTPRPMGKLKASNLVAVEVVPLVGEPKCYRAGEDFDGNPGDGTSGPGGPETGPSGGAPAFLCGESSRPPTCGRTPARSTCPSRSASSSPPGR